MDPKISWWMLLLAGFLALPVLTSAWLGPTLLLLDGRKDRGLFWQGWASAAVAPLVAWGARVYLDAASPPIVDPAYVTWVALYLGLCAPVVPSGLFLLAKVMKGAALHPDPEPPAAPTPAPDPDAAGPQPSAEAAPAAQSSPDPS